MILQTESEILERVASCFNRAFGTPRDRVTAGAGPDQIEGWDSLGHVTLASELEREFSISFEIDDLMEMETVATILAVLGRKLQS